jgi:catalase
MSATDTIATSIEHHLRQHHPPHHRPAVRDAHPKHHGCMRATFTVRPDPSAGDAPAGVFAEPGRAYEAWVRFSNALKERPDLAPDARGMAVKLMDVRESESTTQDFLMVSHDVFFARNAAEFVDFPATVSAAAFTGRAWLRIINFFIGVRPVRFRIRQLLALLRSLKPTWSPLAMEYFSQTPYKFGDGVAMKYCVRPHEPRPWSKRVGIRLRAAASVLRSLFGGTEKSPNMLHEALMDRLKRGPAVFDFCVQVRRLPADAAARARIEDDAVLAWSEAMFPYRKVAEIEIRQIGSGFDVDEMMQLGQHLSFTPWHHVADHEPLGSINLARKTAYERISGLRHQLNGKLQIEPRAGQSAGEYLASIEVAPARVS